MLELAFELSGFAIVLTVRAAKRCLYLPRNRKDPLAIRASQRVFTGNEELAIGFEKIVH